MESPLYIPAVMYQRPDNAGMLTEIFIPSYKIGLNVFGEVFASEESRYIPNAVFNFKGVIWNLGNLANNEITITKFAAELLKNLSKKNHLDKQDSELVKELITSLFPPKTLPGPQEIAEWEKSMIQKKFDPIKSVPSKTLHEPDKEPEDFIKFVPVPIIPPSPKPAPAARSSTEIDVQPKPIASVAPSNDADEEDNYICPISQEIMKDPWMDPEGISYEKVKILEWLEKNSTSPITRTELKKEQLAPNRALKKIIEKKYPHLFKT